MFAGPCVQLHSDIFGVLNEFRQPEYRTFKGTSRLKVCLSNRWNRLK